MQSFGTLISDNKGTAVVVALLAAIIAAAILIFLYRLVFGRRLHMTGTRARQPRLGVVDAFDLDRQRQLVLVRRDNVEHLLMIGGPNDLVIESAFVRAQSSIAVPVGRDKEASPAIAPVVPMSLTPGVPEAGLGPIDTRPSGGDAEVATGRTAPPPLDLVDPLPAKDALARTPLPLPPADPPLPEPRTPPPAAPAASALSPPPAETPPGPPPPAPRPAPTRLGSTLPPRPFGGSLPPRPPLASPRSGAGQPVPPRPPSLLPNRPMPITPLQRGTSAASLRRDTPLPPPPSAADPDAVDAALPASIAAPPPAAEPAPIPEPAPAPAPPADEPAAAESASPDRALVEARPPAPPTIPVTIDTIESLEQEMAKLLGRPAAGDKT